MLLENRNDRIIKILYFLDRIEDDIFDYNKIKDLCIEDKIEFYKNAKDTLKLYVNIAKDVNSLTSDDELLKNIILSLDEEQKKLLKKSLMLILKKEDKKDGDN